MRRLSKVLPLALPPAGKRLVVCAILVSYLALLLQPCAMAMDVGSAQHGEVCHQETTYPEDAGCLSQPVAECANDDVITNDRVSALPDVEQQLVALMPVISGEPALPVVAEWKYFSRAPPIGGPALNILHCVYLK